METRVSVEGEKANGGSSKGSTSPSFFDFKKQVVETAQKLTEKGYLMATGGNLSVRIPNRNALVGRSCATRGRLPDAARRQRSRPHAPGVRERARRPGLADSRSVRRAGALSWTVRADHSVRPVGNGLFDEARGEGDPKQRQRLHHEKFSSG
jgi:hypothetical protein